jgi:catalase
VTTLADQAVEALNELFGRHPGYRAAHAKGTLCRGLFTATPEAAALTRAAHIQGDQVDVTVRFSNGDGDPSAADGVPDFRGMAAKFSLPDGSSTDLVAVTAPCFVARAPEDFVDFTRAGTRKWKVLLYLFRHPEGLRATWGIVRRAPVPSYANCRYNALHAFKWVDRDGGERYVRYSWVPEGGERKLSRRAARRRDRHYLQEEIAERLQGGPVRFDLHVQLAAEEDPVNDPTKVWPRVRETVVAGQLELTGLAEGETAQDVLVFDPMRLTDGIEPSDDRILRFRPQAYAVSVERRSGPGSST